MKRIRNTDFFKEQYANKSSDEEAYISYRLGADPRPANRAGEPEPGVCGTLEPEPLEKKNRSRSRSRSRLEKKSGAGAGAAKKLAGSSALREDKKHKEIVL